MPKFPQVLMRPLPAIRRFVRDRRGAAAVMLAIALSGIIGFAGLGSEVAAWYFTTRAMQNATVLRDRRSCASDQPSPGADASAAGEGIATRPER